MNKHVPILITILLFAFSNSLIAQTCKSCEIFQSLQQKINFQFPIVDSLHPIDTRNLNPNLGLTKKEIKELKKNGKLQRGLTLNSSNIKGAKTIPANSIYKAFKKMDSTNLKFIEQNKPFYLISNPLFFSNNCKAIVDVDLIGRGGYTYLLKRENGKWIIIKEIIRWIV